jgi:phospholipid/cholesterol/gamma-HCH transport system substrate-binding protein
MRRLLAILALVAAVPALLLAGVGAAGDDAGYEVRAIFDTVAAAVEGEDVKVAGAKVGVIQSMDLTRDDRAAVTLRIDDSRFTPFHRDARCTIRPQQLIGEKFVECDPGSPVAAELPRISEGDGEGEHLLPLERTSSTVDLDLVNNVLRRPYAERFAILLSELGVGLAGRGRELNEVIHRANPALRETDRVLRILARENDVLARLAADSDAALSPLAREKERVSGFIVQANATAQATAERRADIERGISRLPRFLRELRPLMADLGSFAGQAAPVFSDLRAAGRDVSRLIVAQEPFAQAARPAFRSLGGALERGRPALIRARPVVRDLRRFGRDAAPTSSNLDRLTRSLDGTGGLERLMDLTFYSTAAINGFDDVGHYLRSALQVNLCTDYAVVPVGGCSARFEGAAAAAATNPSLEPRLAASRTGDASGRPEASVPPLQPVGTLVGGDELREQGLERLRKQAERPSPALEDVGDPLLDYLLEEGP